MNKQKRFTTAWVLEPGHDFSAIKDWVDEYRFILSGSESEMTGINASIKRWLTQYDPLNSVIVAAGRNLGCLLLGQALAIACQEGLGYNLAIYKDGSYIVEHWELDPSQDIYMRDHEVTL